MTPRTIYTVWGNGRRREALRHGAWKIVRNAKKAAWELYDLAADPYERIDLAAEEPAVLADLLRRRDAERAADPK